MRFLLKFNKNTKILIMFNTNIAANVIKFNAFVFIISQFHIYS